MEGLTGAYVMWAFQSGTQEPLLAHCLELVRCTPTRSPMRTSDLTQSTVCTVQHAVKRMPARPPPVLTCKRPSA